MNKNILINAGFQVAALALTLLITILILVAVGTPPFEVLASIFSGAFGSTKNLVAVLISWAPLLLTTAGVLITFSAGLWNIGVEGQMTLGAIFTTGMLRLFPENGFPPALFIILGILAGIIGGALWASLAGALKIFGGVNEIFGGLGLNFVSTALTIYLVFGPWKRPGTGSMSGTQPFGQELWLPTLPKTELSLWALGLSVLGIGVVYLLLNGTHFGLRLKAVGKNPIASYLLGIPTWQYSMTAFILCGAFSGLAGAIQVTGVYHRLLPNISNGYGFLGLLVAMVVNYQAIWAVLVAFLFVSINIGNIQMQIIYKLNSSFSSVLQELLVLLVLLGEGARQRILGKR